MPHALRAHLAVIDGVGVEIGPDVGEGQEFAAPSVDLRQLVESIPAAVYEATLGGDGQWRPAYVSPQAGPLLGAPAEQLVADPSIWQRLVAPDDRPILAEIRAVAGALEAGTVRRDYRVTAGESVVRWIRDEVRVERPSPSAPLVVRGVLTDVTHDHEIQERIRHDARHDALTGLLNRAVLREALEAATAAAVATGRGFALLFMDLDRFKEVNDELGHERGDRLLVALARRLERLLRRSDTIARLGGDEFGIILDGVDDDIQARTMAEEIAAIVEQPFILEDEPVTIGASIGIAIQDGRIMQGAEELMRLADVSMYAAKRGQLGVAIYDASMEDGGRTAHALSFLGEFRAALERHELVLRYQPWLPARAGDIVAVEALVRWEHPERGLLSPGEFLPLVEHAGLSRALDVEVLDLASLQARRWRDSGLHLRTAVNVSRTSLLDEEFSCMVAAELFRHGLEGPEIELEVTENGVMGDPDQAAWFAERLSALGVRLAIDDFGTGYSSLAQLRRLRPSTLKIDRSFVADMLQSEDDAAIVESIIGLGHRFGAEVVAEGVEDEETLEEVISLGADHVQGFVFSRPLPPAEIPGFTSSHGRRR